MGRGRGVNYGGGQSSLGYLLGGGQQSPKPAKINTEASVSGQVANNDSSSNPTVTGAVVSGDVAAGFRGNTGNHYFRADGQNHGNFITDRPSTKVRFAPGGGSSLGYLFGGGNN